VPYQTLINLYLRDCAVTNRKLSLKWRPAAWSFRPTRAWCGPIPTQLWPLERCASCNLTLWAAYAQSLAVNKKCLICIYNVNILMLWLIFNLNGITRKTF
jgi:hypothetical protein